MKLILTAKVELTPFKVKYLFKYSDHSHQLGVLEYWGNKFTNNLILFSDRGASFHGSHSGFDWMESLVTCFCGFEYFGVISLNTGTDLEWRKNIGILYLKMLPSEL